MSSPRKSDSGRGICPQHVSQSVPALRAYGFSLVSQKWQCSYTAEQMGSKHSDSHCDSVSCAKENQVSLARIALMD